MGRSEVLTVGLVAGCLVVFLCGCGAKQSKPGNEKAEEPGIVETMTGVTEAKTYQKTRSKIEDIDKTMKERYQEVQQ